MAPKARRNRRIISSNPAPADGFPDRKRTEHAGVQAEQSGTAQNIAAGVAEGHRGYRGKRGGIEIRISRTVATQYGYFWKPNIICLGYSCYWWVI